MERTRFLRATRGGGGGNGMDGHEDTMSDVSGSAFNFDAGEFANTRKLLAMDRDELGRERQNLFGEEVGVMHAERQKLEDERKRLREEKELLLKQEADDHISAARAEIETQREHLKQERIRLADRRMQQEREAAEAKEKAKKASSRWAKVKSSVNKTADPNTYKPEGELPKGYAFWFATHANPRIFALSGEDRAHELLDKSVWMQDLMQARPSCPPIIFVTVITFQCVLWASPPPADPQPQTQST